MAAVSAGWPPLPLPRLERTTREPRPLRRFARLRRAATRAEDRRQGSLYAPPGYLLFVQQGTLMAQRFDPDRVQLTGEPVAVAEGVAYNAFNGRNTFNVSENGVLVYRTGRPGGCRRASCVWFDRGGKRIGSVEGPGLYLRPALSPDGKRVAVERRDPQTGPSTSGSSTRHAPPSCALHSVRPTRRTLSGRRTGVGSSSLPIEMATSNLYQKTLERSWQRGAAASVRHGEIRHGLVSRRAVHRL